MNLDANVSERVFGFLESQGGIPGETEEDQLSCAYLDERVIDSMGIVEMIVAFEEGFGIHFTPQHMQAPEFRTVGGLIELITQLMGDKGHA